MAMIAGCDAGHCHACLLHQKQVKQQMIRTATEGQRVVCRGCSAAWLGEGGSAVQASCMHVGCSASPCEREGESMACVVCITAVVPSSMVSADCDT